MIVLSVCAFNIFVFDIIELSKVKSGDLTVLITIKLALMKNLDHLQKVLPFLLFITSVITYVFFHNTKELVMFRAVGMSATSICLPPALGAIIFAVLVILLNPITASLLCKYEAVEARYLKGKMSRLSISKSGLWMRQNYKDDSMLIIHALRVSEEEQLLFDITMYELDKDSVFIHRFDIEQARLADGYWHASNITITDANGKDHYMKQSDIPTTIKFYQIQEEVLPPESIPITQLPSFISLTKDAGFSAIRHESYLYKMLFLPLMYCGMSMLGAVFIFMMKNVNVKTIILGIMLSIILYFVENVIIALGMSHSLHVVVASCIPPLVFCMIAIAGMLHIDG